MDEMNREEQEELVDLGDAKEKTLGVPCLVNAEDNPVLWGRDW